MMLQRERREVTVTLLYFQVCMLNGISQPRCATMPARIGWLINPVRSRSKFG